MTLEDFIAEFRRVRQDEQSGYLWSDEEITSYVNEAINEACERALLIEDRTTETVCTISLTVGESSYPLHDSIIKVKRVTLDGTVLPETSIEKMDELDTFWENRSGTPTRYMLDGNMGIRFDRMPTVAEYASMTVYRTPLEPLAAATDVPEIKSLYHLRLMPWVYRCALLKQDSEVFDQSEAEKQEATFIRNFGERPDANVQRKRRDRRPPIVRAIW